MAGLDKIHIYTDGSARGNPGPGGLGVILMYKNHCKEISIGYRYTTNNRMELSAVIEALKKLKTKDIEIVIYTDSKYVANSIQKGWLMNWKKDNFKDRLNADLWKEYLEVSKGLKLSIEWVKGHASNEFNNRCDMLATTASSSDNKPNWLVDKIYESIK
jgi:ribonuclease HI